MTADVPGLSPELADSLEAMSRLRIDERTVDALLQLIVTLACASIQDVDDASVSLVAGPRLQTVSATSGDVVEVDGSQYRGESGPCVAAIKEGVRHNVVLREERAQWPEFVSSAQAAGLHSTLSTPLVSGERTMGALNLYSKRDEPFDDHDVAAAQVFADHAAVILANAVTYASVEANTRHLQTALETARVIGRAQGVLMARRNCSSEEAFDILRRASQRTNRKLREIAEEIVASLERGTPT